MILLLLLMDVALQHLLSDHLINTICVDIYVHNICKVLTAHLTDAH